MGQTAILMACDNNLVFAVANMIIGIKRYCHNDVLKIIIMYDNIQKQEIDKVRSIWLEKIEFKRYSKNDFLNDVGYIDKIKLSDRFGFHLVYAKFYIFNLLKDYESVLWLDVDMLLFDNVVSLLSFGADGTITKGSPKVLNNYLMHLYALESINAIKPNGGFIHFNKSVLRSNNNLTKECFVILKDLYDREFLKGIAWGDEIPNVINQICGYSAKSRIHNHLSYKLGQAMIENSKSLLGYIRMPYVLSYIKDKHKQEQKIYQEKIKKDPSLKLPTLESYPDYKESLKEKECLTYKLGEAFIKADKTWYKGGYVKLWFEVRRLKIENIKKE